MISEGVTKWHIPLVHTDNMRNHGRLFVEMGVRSLVYTNLFSTVVGRDPTLVKLGGMVLLVTAFSYLLFRNMISLNRSCENVERAGVITWNRCSKEWDFLLVDLKYRSLFNDKIKNEFMMPILKAFGSDPCFTSVVVARNLPAGDTTLDETNERILISIHDIYSSDSSRQIPPTEGLAHVFRHIVKEAAILHRKKSLVSNSRGLAKSFLLSVVALCLFVAGRLSVNRYLDTYDSEEESEDTSMRTSVLKEYSITYLASTMVLVPMSILVLYKLHTYQHIQPERLFREEKTREILSNIVFREFKELISAHVNRKRQQEQERNKYS